MIGISNVAFAKNCSHTKKWYLRYFCENYEHSFYKMYLVYFLNGIYNIDCVLYVW